MWNREKNAVSLFPFQQMESSMEFGRYKSFSNVNINMINDYGCRHFLFIQN